MNADPLVVAKSMPPTLVTLMRAMIEHVIASGGSFSDLRAMLDSIPPRRGESDPARVGREKPKLLSAEAVGHLIGFAVGVGWTEAELRETIAALGFDLDPRHAETIRDCLPK